MAASLMSEKRIGALPVVERGKVAGIFSERDLLHSVAREGDIVLHRPVSEVMTTPPITIQPSVDVMSALSLMTTRRVRHLPVVEDDVMIAFISIGDLVKYRIEQVEAEAEQMRDYIAMA
jgi:CBS domain-containing protein